MSDNPTLDLADRLAIEEERSIYWRDLAGKLERENAALLKDVCDLVHKNELLREDKERLDWLLTDEGKGWLVEEMRLGFQTDRADIDSVRTEAQP